MSSAIRVICVCGAGTMGSGIAQVCAQAGFHTILYDLSNDMLEKAKAGIEKSLSSLLQKGKLTSDEKERTLSHLQFSSQLNDCIADLVIEAIIEKPAAKIALFNQLSEVNHSETIFASNTSSLSVSAIAKEIIQPARVAGMHFFNPAPLMKLVEIVRAEKTDEKVIKQLIDLTKQLGKTPVLCKDAPGFIVNHVARPYYLEALRLVEEGVADIETIDELLESTGFKMGPFKLMDLIGNDINFAVSTSVYEQLGKPERLKPSPLQQEKVEAGELGKKSGKGYYQYQ